MVKVTEELWLRSSGNRVVLGGLRPSTDEDGRVVETTAARIARIRRQTGSHTMQWYAADETVYVYVDQTEHYMIEEVLRQCPEIDIAASINA